MAPIEFGKNIDADLLVLLTEGKANLPRFNAALVEKAFRFCVEAHRKDIRATGEPYYTHPLQVA
jgi:(p)ppGpp synthase/HD superfamily hydrolase